MKKIIESILIMAAIFYFFGPIGLAIYIIFSLICIGLCIKENIAY